MCILGRFLSATLSQAKMPSVVLPQQATVFPTFNYLFIGSPASVYHPVRKLTPRVSSVDHGFFLSHFIMAALFPVQLLYQFSISAESASPRWHG